MTHTQGKKEAASEGAQTLAKKFESSYNNMFKELKETVFKELKESMITISHQAENINQETDMILK